MNSYTTNINNTNISIILIHGGYKHYPSKCTLNIWNQYKERYQFITDIEVVDNRVKQWLTCNTYGIVINEIPCILFCRAGNKAIIYSIEHLDKILKSIHP